MFSCEFGCFGQKPFIGNAGISECHKDFTDETDFTDKTDKTNKTDNTDETDNHRLLQTYHGRRLNILW